MNQELKINDNHQKATAQDKLDIQTQNISVRRNYIHSAPRKIRLVSNILKNKQIEAAINILQFTNKRAAKPLIEVLKSALAKAKETWDNKVDYIYIKNIRVDEGPKLKRRRIIHRGRSTDILKRMSRVTVVLSEQSRVKIKRQKEK